MQPNKVYNGFESRPVFSTVEEMLKWMGLYGLTRRNLEQELLDAAVDGDGRREVGQRREGDGRPGGGSGSGSVALARAHLQRVERGGRSEESWI